jgi:hypothetical protein
MKPVARMSRGFSAAVADSINTGYFLEPVSILALTLVGPLHRWTSSKIKSFAPRKVHSQLLASLHLPNLVLPVFSFS